MPARRASGHVRACRLASGCVATLAVLLSEIVVFLPYIAHERSSWMSGRIEDAAIAVIAAANGTMDTARHDELLFLADTEAIRVTDRDGAVMIGNVAMPPDATIDLRAGESSRPHPVARSAPSCCGRTA